MSITRADFMDFGSFTIIIINSGTQEIPNDKYFKVKANTKQKYKHFVSNNKIL